MNRKIIGLALILSVVAGCDQLMGGAGEDGGVSQQGRREPPPVICEVPACGRRALTAAVRAEEDLPSKRLRASSPADSRAVIQAAFRAGDPGARYLAHWAIKSRRAGLPTGGLWALTPPPSARSEWLARALDQLAPGWERLVDAPTPDPPAAVALETARYALETSGCGPMALRMRLRSVTVIEREDNFAEDSIYCVFQSQARDRLEVLQTEVVGPLGAGERATFENGIYFGQEGTRDPGEEVNLSYTCFEQDGPAEYARIRETLDEILDAVEQFAKVTNPKWQAFVVSVRRAVDLVLRIAQALDGDDQLYHAEERLDRRALWALIVEGERRFEMGGTNYGSDWSWRLALDYDGCAGEPQVDEGAAPSSGGDVVPEGCGPQTCDGCCVGDRCQGGLANDQCGTGGDACRTCETLDSCLSGRCTFDEDRRFEVAVTRAEIAERKANGTCWDLDCSAPDVYVILRAAGQSERTSMQRSFNPQWDGALLTGVPARTLMDAMEVVVVDDDTLDDDLIGRCNPAFSASALTRGRATVECGQARVVLGFTPR